MKNFKNLNFGGNEVLQRSQMKNILGGNTTITEDGMPCPQSKCSNNNECPSPFRGCYDYLCEKGSSETFKQCGY